MECNMIKNGLRMVRGNAFSLRIKVRAYRIDGTEIGDFVLNPLTDTLLLTSSSTVRPLEFSVEDGSTNNAVVSFGAAMQAGYYGLDFSGVWDGVAWRFSAKNVFQIVELTAQGNVPKDGVIYDDTYDTHVEVTLTSQSVQSDWAQNDPTNPAYIRNKPEIYTKAEINVLLDNIYTKSEVDGLISDEEARAKAAEKANADDIDDIEALIPAQATPQNQLADKQYVDDGISTASATYRGAYNLVSDLELTVAATEQQIAAALATKMTALGITPDNNDYCFVQVPTADATPTEIARVDRYKYNGTAWAFEFSLNNSGFTAAQWAALNSGITSGLVAKLGDLPTNSELTTLLGGKEDKSNKVTSLSAESTDTQYPSAKCVYDLHKANADDIDGIEDLIPAQATPQNQLADKQYVDDGISTASATYRGAYNLVSDLELTTAATEQQIAAALATKMTALSITPDNNDYCFVQVPTSDATPTEIARVDRYKFNGTAWAFEFSLNNSGFTAAQWAALNSGITSGLVTKLSDLPTNSELTTLLAGKQDTINDLSDIRSGAAKGATAYQKPVGGIPSEDMSSGVQSSLQKAENAAPQSTTYNKTEVDGMIGGIEEKIPSGASSQNKLVDQQTMNSSIATATATYRGAYNLVSDLELTVSATEQQIAAALATKMTALGITPDNNDYCFVQVPTSDDTPTEIARVDRYKFNGTEWAFEFSLNNSGFTAAQWAALNSGITSGLVTKLSDLPTYTELMTLFGGKQDTINDLSDIRSGAAAGATAYQKPQGGIPETDLTAALQQALASFITKSVNDLLNYYLKSETYTKTEVNTLINAVKQFTYVLVQTLPTASADTMNKIYLVPSADPQTQNVKDEYITIATENGGTTTYAWEQIGSTAIDLSGYYTSTQTDSAISSALSSALASYSTTSQMNNAIASALASYYTKTEIDAALALKASQSELTSLTGRVTINEYDIAALQDAYEALTQSDIVAVAPTDTWPVTNPEENVIYRVADRTHTPPQYYTDYMWNGSSFVVLAQFSGDIDELVEKVEEIEEALSEEVPYIGPNVTDEEITSATGVTGVYFNRYNNPVGLTLKGVKVKVNDPHGPEYFSAYLYYAHEDGDSIVYDGYVSLGNAANGVNSYTLQTPITLQPKSLLAVGLLDGTTDASKVSYVRSSTSRITWMAFFPGKTTNSALQAMAAGTTAALPTGSSVIQGYVALQLNAVAEEIVVLHSDDVVEIIRDEFETGVVCKNYLYGKTLVSHGDSEVAGQGIGVQNTYPNLIAARNNMTVYNYGLGGRSLVIGLEDLKQCPEGANYITIQIGWNDLQYWDASVSDDSTDVTTFKGAFNNLVGYYQENFPAAHLVIILPLYINDVSRYDISMWEKERCATLNIACIDINPYCGMRRAVPALSDMYWMDAIHLKAAGHLRISYMYEAKLREM